MQQKSELASQLCLQPAMQLQGKHLVLNYKAQQATINKSEQVNVKNREHTVIANNRLLSNTIQLHGLPSDWLLADDSSWCVLISCQPVQLRGRCMRGGKNHECSKCNQVAMYQTNKYQLWPQAQTSSEGMICRHLTSIEVNFRPMSPIWCPPWGLQSQSSL